MKRVFMDDRAFPPGSRAHAVMGRLEGWPAAAMLVLAHAASDDSGDLDQKALTAAVSASMPDPRSRQVLALVAVLPRMSERFLAEAAGLTPREVTPLLLDLQDRGLIRRSWVGARQVYSPHPAVQDPVFWAGTAQLLPAQVRDLQLRFAHQLGPEEAARGLHLLLEASEYEAADQYILDRFSALVADPGAALPLLRAIPEAERSRMVGALGLSLTLERPAGAVPAEGLDQLAETLLQAVRNPAEQGSSAGSPWELALLLVAERTVGRWERALTQARQLERALAQQPYHLSPTISSGLPMTYGIIAVTGILVGDIRLGERAAQRGLEVAEDEQNPAEQVRALNLLALLAAMRGDPETSAAQLARSDVICAATGAAPPEMSGINGALAAALTATLMGDHRGAQTLLAGLQPLLPRMEQWPLFVAIEAGVRRSLRGSAAAFHMLRQRLLEHDIERVSPQLRGSLVGLMADLAMYSGQLKAAEQLLSTPTLQVPALLVSRARLAMLQGDPLRAVELSQDARTLLPGGRDLPEALLIGAVALFLTGDLPAALSLWAELKPRLHPATRPDILAGVPQEALQRFAAAVSEAGDPALSAALERLPAQPLQQPVRVTAAERRTIVEVARGGTVKEGAVNLGVSANTVKSHLRSVYRKLGVSTRTEMLREAAAAGLL